VSQSNPPLARLHFEYAAVEVSTAVGAADEVALLVALVATVGAFRAGAHLIVHHLHFETTVAAVEVTFVGVDDTVRAAHGFVLLGTEARTGTALPAGPQS